MKCAASLLGVCVCFSAGGKERAAMSGYTRLSAVIDTAVEDNRAAPVGMNRIAVEAQEVRQKTFSFREFYKNQVISDSAYSFGDQYLNASGHGERTVLVRRDPKACVDLFTSMISSVRKDDVIQFMLTLLSDLTEDMEFTAILVSHCGKDQLVKPLLNILFRNDNYSKFQASLVLARLTSCLDHTLHQDDLNQYLSWTISQLLVNNDYLMCVTRALMTFLKKECYREPFFDSNGVKPILDILDKKISFQLQYQLIFCIWNLSFEESVVEKMKDYPVAVVLCDVLRSTNREKVKRVILATFHNLLEKPSREVSGSYATEMIHFKAVPVINVMSKQTWQDADLQADVEYLSEKLNNSLQDLSSFDEYLAEVKTGRLEWSPVHRSDKFWRENVMRLNDNNYEVLGLLTTLLQESQNPVVIAVAAHDLGEYVRYYPRGKKVVDKLKAKELVMNLVNHKQPEVRIQALLSIQKMMVHNWEYLGKQLEKETS